MAAIHSRYISIHRLISGRSLLTWADALLLFVMISFPNTYIHTYTWIQQKEWKNAECWLRSYLSECFTARIDTWFVWWCRRVVFVSYRIVHSRLLYVPKRLVLMESACNDGELSLSIEVHCCAIVHCPLSSNCNHANWMHPKMWFVCSTFSFPF